MEEWYRSLLRLRREGPELRGGRLEEVETAADDATCTLVVRRAGVVVAANLGGEPASVEVPGGLEGARIELASADGAEVEGGRVKLPAESVAILVR